VQRRVQFAVLLQLAGHGMAARLATSAMVPGTGDRDLTVALESLLDDGAIDGPTGRLESLIELAEAGRMTLARVGRLRVDEDEV
jgi:hypothetical protein